MSFRVWADKLEERGCNGPPDMVIEIVSPSTTRYDRTVKFNKYREAGVREYWIVDPEGRDILTYVLKDDEYTAMNYGDTGSVPVSVLPGCAIDFAAVLGPPIVSPPPARSCIVAFYLFLGSINSHPVAQGIEAETPEQTAERFVRS
jgi:hypothetical protein